MGSSSSKTQRVDETLKHQMVDERIHQINRLNSHLSSNNEESNELGIIYPSVPLLDIAKTQMERRDKPLTKADLMSIIMALEPEKRLNICELNKLTVKELTLMMRLIIYDPERYGKRGLHSTPPIEVQAILCDEPIYVESMPFEQESFEESKE